MRYKMLNDSAESRVPSDTRVPAMPADGKYDIISGGRPATLVVERRCLERDPFKTPIGKVPAGSYNGVIVG